MLPVALSGTVTALSSLSESVTSIASATKSTTCPCTAAQHQMTREAFACVSVFKGNALTETNLLKSLYPTDRSKNPRPTKNKKSHRKNKLINCKGMNFTHIRFTEALYRRLELVTPSDIVLIVHSQASLRWQKGTNQGSPVVMDCENGALPNQVWFRMALSWAGICHNLSQQTIKIAKSAESK